MKQTLILALLTIALSLQGQISAPNKLCDCKYKDFWKVAVNAAVFGAAQGQMDAFNFHSTAAAKVLGTTPDKIDVALTWRSKYANGDPAQGERFLGSTTLFSSFTDPWHATKMVQNISYSLMPIMMPQKCSMTKTQKWTIPIGSAVIKSIFFTLVYDGIYR